MEAAQEEKNLQSHLRDLADQSYRQDIYTFSNFLSLSDAEAYYKIENELRYAAPSLFGGYENAERKLVRFGSEAVLGYSVDFPISCIHIFPLMEKFADDLSHRDFLGALMNLGIERDVLGDIKAGEKECYIFCLESMADFICKNLSKVKHTSVRCELVTDISTFPEDIPEEKLITVSSERADGLIAKVYNLSRSESLKLFSELRVYMNGRLLENNSKQIAAGDVINARGYGKFRVKTDPAVTKKGKLAVTVEIYR